MLMSVLRFSIGKKLNLMHSISLHRYAWWIKDIIEFCNQFIPPGRGLVASIPSLLMVASHRPGDRFTVRLQQH